MGIYIRDRNRPKRSIRAALEEAEEDHLLDCENADLMIRAAALVLDLIFMFLMHSGLNRINLSFSAYSLSHIPNLTPFIEPFFLAVEAVIIYLFCIWTVLSFGASPAKLLLRLRIIDARSGQKLSLRRVVARELIGKYLTMGLCGLTIVWMLLNRERRTLHDIYTQSVVKKIVGPP